MAMQYLENELRRTGDPRKQAFADVIAGIHQSLGSDIPFLSVATTVEKEAMKTPELAFEIPGVSEALYKRTREALANEGYTFIVAIEPLSIGQLATDEATSQRFAYVTPSENMRAIVPPKMEIAINPSNLRIKNSKLKSTDDQIRMLEEEEATLKSKLPPEIRDLISIRIQNASVLAQIDHEYKQKTGKVLFTNWFGRTDDQTVPGSVANVGRFGPTSRLRVDDWLRDDGFDDVFAVPVVVLSRK